MKFLLAIIMSTVFASAAFGACSVGSPQDCAEEAACIKLSTDSKKFVWDEKAKQKCMTEEQSIKTKCIGVNDSSSSSSSSKGSTSGSNSSTPAKDSTK